MKRASVLLVRFLYEGADVRKPLDAADADWSDERRARYLLRLDVVRPLSVDRNVWASVVGVDEALPWTGVDDVCVKHPSHGVVIAIGLLVAVDQDEILARSRGVDCELRVEPRWRFLGFDVDDGGISGLSNCGYGDDARRLRDVWASRLNEHGLFDEPADAIAFRILTDERVPEHAPFSVHGIWRVQPMRST